ncbi:MBL fold metallo-hydrolase RNA specificity domain-containing protein [Pseudohongiella sp.]|nr:MBL fold metallo-hydrolase [Pseudohongiella sp.]HDZ07899.1 MBL fold metallo-hydrolase [Pseudohongiella sp.]HEA64494.1 MBL fold metallo-hydrolase [Pseudohongiella sp.]
MATLTFYGAAQEVTGSCYLIESPALGRVLLECGMHQGGTAVDRIRDESFAFDPADIDAVVLSHGHLDHSGMLPKLVNQGFSGPIYCTQSTRQLLRILFEDALGLYERDLERENLRRQRSGRALIEPEYTEKDVEAALKLCQGQPYHARVDIGPQASVRFLDAGHILGSSIVELTLNEKGADKVLVFSGDLGNSNSALMNDPESPQHADIVMMEGTYGNRDHRSQEQTLEQFRQVLAETWARGGNVMIPSFAIGRTQELIFHLGCLHQAGELDDWQVFLDSPMAIAVTEVYDRWLHIMDDDDVRCLTEAGRDSLAKFLPNLKLCRSAEESMAINKIKHGAIIIAGSGMCTGGRIRHHFKHRIWREENAVIFIGFQAQGTLGRLLVDGRRDIKMFGDEFKVRARIETIGGLSAHAGQTALMEWAAGFDGKPKLVLIHGEATALDALSQKLWLDKGIRSDIPAPGSSIVF